MFKYLILGAIGFYLYKKASCGCSSSAVKPQTLGRMSWR